MRIEICGLPFALLARQQPFSVQIQIARQAIGNTASATHIIQSSTIRPAHFFRVDRNVEPSKDRTVDLRAVVL
jgi:hypothetical protein